MVNYIRQNYKLLWVTQTQISEVMKLYIIVNYSNIICFKPIYAKMQKHEHPNVANNVRK